MNADSPSKENPISEAKLAANRANAKLSTGPGAGPDGTARWRFNARKHGLTARLDGRGQDARQQEFVRLAWARLGPRNPLEELYVSNLLENRLRESVFLDVEQTVLTRKPVLLAPMDNERPYPFLRDPTALKTLEQMARHQAHLTRALEKDVLTLLRVRKEQWGEPSENTQNRPVVEGWGATDVENAAVVSGKSDQPEAQFQVNPESLLEDCATDTRLVLPGEDADSYQVVVRKLWASFRPANMLEAFVISDYIQAKWRLDRVSRIQDVLLERSAISVSRQNCGVGFAFINDSQQNQALGSLAEYEASLRRRLDRRLELWRKIRAGKWEDAPLPAPVSSTTPQPSNEAPPPQTITTTIPTAASLPIPNDAATPVCVAAPVESAGPPGGLPASQTSDNPAGAPEKVFIRPNSA